MMNPNTPINYGEMLDQLKEATLFDLYRLEIAIHNKREDPERIRQVRYSFKEGDTISYFNAKLNSLFDAVVIQKNQQTVVVEHIKDRARWTTGYHALNIARVDIDIPSEKLSKNNLKLGEIVGFNHDGTQISGVVIRLNHKTVSLMTESQHRWRVSYSCLHKVIDVEIAKKFNAAQIARWTKEELALPCIEI